MITYEEYSRWFNSARLDRTVCGALATRMALRIFPFFAAKVSDAQDAARAKFYLELAAAAISALAVIRASSKYPQYILRSQPHDAEKWLGRCEAAFSGQDAKAREAAATAAAVVAVSKAEADKGSPLSESEREQVSSDAKRDSRVSSLRADTTVSACASIAAYAIRVFTSHEIAARDLPRYARLAEWGNAFMSALEADVKALTSGANAGALSDMPLWPAGEPEWAAANWAALRDGLSQAAGWSIWSRWYGDRLTGSISGDTSELIFVGDPEAVWKEGANAWSAYLQKSLTKTIGDAATVPSEKEQLQAEARTAILLRRTDLPVSLDHPALSYLGGLPKLPTNFDWPRAEVRADVEEEIVALTFLAQIDLSELPQFDARTLLPERGTLFLFCSSVFEGGAPPCRVLYYPESAAQLPQTEPPPDLMPLAAQGGDYEAGWLRKEADFHACVEFKYPLSFITYKDYGFKNDPVGGELLVRSLCEALGPGVPADMSLRMLRDADAFAKDKDWLFNWSLVAHVVRSVISRIESDLRPNPYREPQKDETRQALLNLLSSAQIWREKAATHRPFERPGPSFRKGIRGWWANIVSTYKGLKGDVSTYDFQFPNDVQKAIAHNIKLLAERGAKALAEAPSKYVDNLVKRNHWTAPRPDAGRYRSFSLAIHQILGHGKAVQNAPAEHRDDVLLLQLHGDDAFFPWHDNRGCVLQLWIEKNALLQRDLSGVQATLECD